MDILITEEQLKTLTDVNMTGAENNDVLVYKSDTKTFVVEPAEAVIPNLDAGFF